MGKINSTKTVAGGLVFDSQTEALYYLHLTNDTDVKHIEIQPQYTLLESFKIRCSKCKARGKHLLLRLEELLSVERVKGKVNDYVRHGPINQISKSFTWMDTRK